MANRRQFLRAAGAAVALPRLDSFATGDEIHYADRRAIERILDETAEADFGTRSRGLTVHADVCRGMRMRRTVGDVSRRLRDGGAVIGVDFTSAPSRRKPLTVAVGRWRATAPRPSYELDEIRLLTSLDAFDRLLAEPGRWVGGFDLPFGQPRSLIEHEGWPTEWPEFVRFYCDQPRTVLRDVFRTWCAARPAGDKFAWRKTDRPAGSSPAMRWANPPVAWMMHAGIGRMLAADLAFPAHRHDPRGSGKVALEAYPGFTARLVCRRSYKSDAAAKHTPDRRANRRAILQALVKGTAGLDIALVISTTWRRRIVADGSGDLLDAVICGLQAAHAATLPHYGVPRGCDPLEGWIAGVPGST